MNSASLAAHKALIQSWNLQKGVNAFLILMSFWLSRIQKRPFIWGLPFSLSVEPTTSCNLRCPECPSGLRSFTRPTGMLDAAFFETFINSVAHHAVYLNFYFQGEPFLHPKFLDLVSLAVQRNIFTSTSTNAHYLTPKMAERVVESGLHRIVISLDGASQEVYQNYRKGGKVDKVFEGIKNIQQARLKAGKKSPEIVVQNLLVKPNIHEKHLVEAKARELGADRVVFKTAQVYDLVANHPLVPDESKYSRYRTTSSGKLEIKNPMLNQCWRMWSGCVMTWDGRIVPCCFDKDATHQMGNLHEKPLAHIWKGQAYTNFRKAILKSRSTIDICTNCTEGTKVWA